MASVLQEILARLEPEHAKALDWFREHEGEAGPRPWRRKGQSVVPGVQMAMTAERGIHKPAELEYALSVSATRTSIYLDGKPSRVDASTWVLPYREHSGAEGSGEGSRWNRALLKNLRDRVPVGVFVPAAGSNYLNLGLAMPQSFDPETGTFLLRGPMTFAQSDELWAAQSPETDEGVADEAGGEAFGLTRLRASQGRFRDMLMRAYGGRCCVTRYDAEPALQAAHILSYSGRSSQVPQNGLLLRADVHLLFDRHLVAVNPQSRLLHVSPRISHTAYAKLAGRTVHAPTCEKYAPDTAKLEVHWAVFERAGSA